MKQAKWLLLVHQIPPQPSYFRAKVGRRLQKIGAVPIKNSVYVLPHNAETQEDFQWATREIISEGGDATLCTASLVEGMRDEQVEALFHAAREADYAQIAEDARAALRDEGQLEGALARLGKRMQEVAAIDFFGAPGREAAQTAVDQLAKRAHKGGTPKDTTPHTKRAEFQRRTWVTRKNVHVDRIASAWLIQRFIDDHPRFEFVENKGYVAKAKEVTFDMFEATFTHVGDRCTFEVLVDRFGLRESGLRVIAEIVHDIDLTDGKYNRPDTAGVASMIAGIALLHRDDDKRIEVGGALFDALLELHRRKR